MLPNRTQGLLIVNSGAGSVDGGVLARLEAAFPDYESLRFPPDRGFLEQLAPGAPVIACGGDGTIAAIARALAGTSHRFGILPMGTFNNFARALAIPTDLEQAIAVVKGGAVRDCTLGRINGQEFLEVASIGFFGDALAVGESAKDLHFGDVLTRLRGTGGRSFRYRITGDVTGEGEAVSILLANTPSTGALLPVDPRASPEAPHLELLITRAAGPLGELRDLVEAAITRQPPEPAERYQVTRVRIETEPAARAYADVSAAGETPAQVEALAGGLRVLTPA